MPRFKISFFKEVTGDTGQDVDARQAVFEVEADDEHAAVELAKTRFCNERQIRSWTVNADRVEVELRPGRERAAPVGN